MALFNFLCFSFIFLSKMLKQFSSNFLQQLRQFNSFKRLINSNLQHKCLIHSICKKQFNLQNQSISTNPVEEQILEYYECYEEDAVQFLPEIEPYLRKDLTLRPLSTISPDEIIEVLQDQRAKEIEFFESSGPFTIICSPYNKRHGKALMIILRTFMKRNFFFENIFKINFDWTKTLAVGMCYIWLILQFI
ncbi:hypothetical protein Mgra_00009673 [Meloidogyne graminicola]|uniref:Uncharacterized protein n=1 Tax=Meloidogyne graminicola TaxID=189291 RepID=A0A8S9ZD03_9BILA|nr:hypothetical protein Mgra_00009673 [Meloidogyne graminicola]